MVSRCFQFPAPFASTERFGYFHAHEVWQRIHVAHGMLLRIRNQALDLILRRRLNRIGYRRDGQQSATVTIICLTGRRKALRLRAPYRQHRAVPRNRKATCWTAVFPPWLIIAFTSYLPGAIEAPLKLARYGTASCVLFTFSGRGVLRPGCPFLLASISTVGGSFDV